MGIGSRDNCNWLPGWIYLEDEITTDHGKFQHMFSTTAHVRKIQHVSRDKLAQLSVRDKLYNSF